MTANSVRVTGRPTGMLSRPATVRANRGAIQANAKRLTSWRCGHLRDGFVGDFRRRPLLFGAGLGAAATLRSSRPDSSVDASASAAIASGGWFRHVWHYGGRSGRTGRRRSMIQRSRRSRRPSAWRRQVRRRVGFTVRHDGVIRLHAVWSNPCLRLWLFQESRRPLLGAANRTDSS